VRACSAHGAAADADPPRTTAGKTTACACRSGFLRADAGSITIHGIDAVADPIGNKQITACLLDESTIYERLTPMRSAGSDFSREHMSA
jgi:ABC-type Na+ transport system ATPase subunit NatA